MRPPRGRSRRDLLVEVDGIDADGHATARPVEWTGDGEAPVIVIDSSSGPAAAPGDRAVVSIRRQAGGRAHGRIRRILEPGPDLVTGVFRKGRGGGVIVDTRRSRVREYRAERPASAGLRDGDLVLAEPLRPSRFGPPRARVVRTFGSWSDPDAISLAAIVSYDVPTEFPAAVREEAERAAGVTDAAGRADLTGIPLVTIDDDDARDHDDAVFAETAGDGWHGVVAIADVAHYVRPGSALDREARRRGTSVYFPASVVPMLPGRLSGELCSLRPGAVRPCLAVHLWIDGDGVLRRWEFVRGIMRSAARLTYDEVEGHLRGAPSRRTRRLPRDLMDNLHGVFRALLGARRRRGALDIDRAEQKVTLRENGTVATVTLKPRLDSHRLIEEMMIAANVAAARELLGTSKPALFRVHDRPAPEKVGNLREYLGSLGLSLGGGPRPRPRDFARVLKEAAGADFADPVTETVLRCQSLAAYHPVNIGHFGLALESYCHFTSPIRRYADLAVHRILLGEAPPGRDELVRLADHLAVTERRAAGAERSAMDHYVVEWLAARRGAVMNGRITGLGRFGLFVRLEGTGADGLVPARTLRGGPFRFHEGRQELAGRGVRFHPGDRVAARLVEADTVAATLVLELVNDS